MQMYNIIKDKLVDDRVASWRETPVYTDQHGNEVEESETEQFGREQNVKIDYPNYLIFADETGCNMNMKKDGHVAGRTYLCKPGSVPQTICYTNDHQFMVLLLMSVLLTSRGVLYVHAPHDAASTTIYFTIGIRSVCGVNLITTIPWSIPGFFGRGKTGMVR